MPDIGASREPAAQAASSFDWPRWVLASIVVHVLFLAGLLYLIPALRPERDPNERLIPVTLLHESAPANTEYELPQEILYFRQQTHARVREVLKIESEVLALAPPPDEAILTETASGGGFSFEFGDSAALDGFLFGGTQGGLAATGSGVSNSSGGVGTFEEYIGGLRQIGLEVVFVIDATGSMGWLIQTVKERVRVLSDWIRELVPVTRFGIVAYRDDDDPEFLTRVLPLTLNVGKVRAFLADLESRGGGDAPEGVTAGLRAATEKSGWTRDTKKVIVILGDAPPHANELDQALALAMEFRAKGGSVTTVDVSFDANPELVARRLGKRVEDLLTVSDRGILPEFRQLALAGGGDAASLEGDERVVRQLAVLIFGKRWAEAVQPLLGEL